MELKDPTERGQALLPHLFLSVRRQLRNFNEFLSDVNQIHFSSSEPVLHSLAVYFCLLHLVYVSSSLLNDIASFKSTKQAFFPCTNSE